MSNELGNDAKLAQEAARLARRDFDWAVGRVYELLKIESQLPKLEERIADLEANTLKRDEKGRFLPLNTNQEN